MELSLLKKAYPQQVETAYKIILNIKNCVKNILVTARPQIGKTGTVAETIAILEKGILKMENVFLISKLVFYF